MFFFISMESVSASLSLNDATMDNPSPVPVEDKDTKEIRDQTTDRLLYSYDKSHGCFVSADTGEPVCHRLVVRDPKTLEPKHVHTMVVDMAPVLLLPMFASERIGEARRNILVTGMKELVQKSYEGYEQLLRDYPDHHLERVPITEHIVVTTSDHKTQENMADVVHVDDADVYKTDGGPISSNTKRVSFCHTHTHTQVIVVYLLFDKPNKP